MWTYSMRFNSTDNSVSRCGEVYTLFSLMPAHSIDIRIPSHQLGSRRGTVHHPQVPLIEKQHGVLIQYQSTRKCNTAILGSSLHEKLQVIYILLQPRNKSHHRHDAPKKKYIRKD